MRSVLDRLQWLEQEMLRLKKRTTVGGGGVPTSTVITQITGFPGDDSQVLLGDGTFGAPPGSSGQPITPIDHGNSGASLTLDWDASTRHLFTLTGNAALTLSNPVDGGAYVVVIDTGAGSFTPTWPFVVWTDDTAPDTTDPGISILITLLYLDNLAMYLGSFNMPYDVGS